MLLPIAVVVILGLHRGNLSSGAGTNLKVGEAHVRREAPEFFCRALGFFGSTGTISRFGERFHDGQYSWVSFLFAVFLLAVLFVLSHL